MRQFWQIRRKEKWLLRKVVVPPQLSPHRKLAQPLRCVVLVRIDKPLLPASRRPLHESPGLGLMPPARVILLVINKRSWTVNNNSQVLRISVSSGHFLCWKSALVRWNSILRAHGFIASWINESSHIRNQSIFCRFSIISNIW